MMTARSATEVCPCQPYRTVKAMLASKFFKIHHQTPGLVLIYRIRAKQKTKNKFINLFKLKDRMSCSSNNWKKAVVTKLFNNTPLTMNQPTWLLLLHLKVLNT